MYAYLREHPEGCTIDEVAAAADVSYNTAVQYLKRLTKGGAATKRLATWKLNGP